MGSGSPPEIATTTCLLDAGVEWALKPWRTGITEAANNRAIATLCAARLIMGSLLRSANVRLQRRLKGLVHKFRRIWVDRCVKAIKRWFFFQTIREASLG